MGSEFAVVAPVAQAALAADAFDEDEVDKRVRNYYVPPLRPAWLRVISSAQRSGELWAYVNGNLYTTFPVCWNRYQHALPGDFVPCDKASRPRPDCFRILYVQLEHLDVIIGEGEETPPPRRIPTPDAVLMLDAPPVILPVDDIEGAARPSFVLEVD